MSANDAALRRYGRRRPSRISMDLMYTSMLRSMPPSFRSFSDERYGSGRGSPGGRKNAGTRYGSSASHVTTHGEIVVAKFFERNGPSGWYSHDWMSRADQSLTRQTPKICSSASPIGTGSPRSLPLPTKKPT